MFPIFLFVSVIVNLLESLEIPLSLVNEIPHFGRRNLHSVALEVTKNTTCVVCTTKKKCTVQNFGLSFVVHGGEFRIEGGTFIVKTSKTDQV